MTSSEETEEKTIYSNETAILTSNYTYSDNGISKIEYQDGKALQYIYDNEGNTISIIENGEEKASYEYDGLGQLIRENSVYANNTVVYNYDNAGNILKAEEYAYTSAELGEVISEKNYSYDDAEWKDLLTSFNGQNITYDEIGNPLSCRDGMQFTWNGRQLSSLQQNNNVVYYTYNSDGIRTAKTVNGVETTYQLDGNKIISETTNDNIKWFIYDENDSIIGFEYNAQAYYFEKNAQGDIVRIFDADGNFVSEYFYDAWGNIASISGNQEIAEANPFRYRGYYYDNESGLYYLQSRYYDSYTCRFLNADDSELSMYGNHNQFNYCFSNPVNFTDPAGYWVMSIGIEAKAYCIFGIATALSVNFDKKGYFSISWAIGPIISFNVGASVAIYASHYMNYNSVSNIKGWAFSTGVDWSFGIHLGGSGCFELSSKMTGAASVSCGAGISLAPIPTLFVKASWSKEIYKKNIKDFLKKGKTITKKKLGFKVTIKPYSNYVKVSNNKTGYKIYVYKSGKMAIRK